MFKKILHIETKNEEEIQMNNIFMPISFIIFYNIFLRVGPLNCSSAIKTRLS